MIAGKKENLAARSAEDQIEMVEDIAPQNADVGCAGIGKGGELAPDFRGAPSSRVK
jgi:hypothetical protein